MPRIINVPFPVVVPIPVAVPGSVGSQGLPGPPGPVGATGAQGASSAALIVGALANGLAIDGGVLTLAAATQANAGALTVQQLTDMQATTATVNSSTTTGQPLSLSATDARGMINDSDSITYTSGYGSPVPIIPTSDLKAGGVLSITYRASVFNQGGETRTMYGSFVTSFSCDEEEASGYTFSPLPAAVSAKTTVTTSPDNTLTINHSYMGGDGVIIVLSLSSGDGLVWMNVIPGQNEQVAQVLLVIRRTGLSLPGPSPSL